MTLSQKERIDVFHKCLADDVWTHQLPSEELPPSRWLEDVEPPKSIGDALRHIAALKRLPPNRPDITKLPDSGKLNDTIECLSMHLDTAKRRIDKCDELKETRFEYREKKKEASEAEQKGGKGERALTDDEIKVLIVQTMQAPFKWYEFVGAWMTEGRDDEDVKTHIGPYVRLYIQVLSKLPHCIRNAHRVMKVGNIETLKKMYDDPDAQCKPGAHVNFWGIASFTTTAKVMEIFTKKDDPCIVYTCPNLLCADIKPFSVKPQEHEVMPMCPAMFRVETAAKIPHTSVLHVIIRWEPVEACMYVHGLPKLLRFDSAAASGEIREKATLELRDATGDVRNTIKGTIGQPVVQRLQRVRDAVLKKEETDFADVEAVMVSPSASNSQLLANPFDLAKEVCAFHSSEDAKQRAFLALGESGSGKTTLLHHLNKEMWQAWDGSEKNTKNPIPIYVPLRQARDLQHLIRDALGDMGFAADDVSAVELYLQQPSVRVVFLLDAVDEIPKLVPLFEQTDIKAYPNAKIVLTCRPEFVKGSVSKMLVPWKGALTPQYDQLRTVYVVPFSDEQINDYLDKFAAWYKKEKDAAWFRIQLDALPSLKALCGNPFVLYLSAMALPDIVREQEEEQPGTEFTMLAVYERFIRNYHEYQAARLVLMQRWDADKTDALIELFEKYSRDLSNDMVLASTTAVNSAEAPWKSKYFLPTGDEDGDPIKCGERQAIVRSGCLLRRSDTFYSFVHKSVMEFFAACRSGTKEDNSDDLLARRLLTHEDYKIISFYVDRARSEASFTQYLYGLIEASKKPTASATASPNHGAANALTILTLSERIFRGKDFSNTQLAGAILHGGFFYSCNFDSADLSHTNLSNTVVVGCSFDKTKFRDATIGYRELKRKEVGKHFALSPDGKTIATAKYASICLFDVATFKELRALRGGYEEDVVCLAFSPSGNKLVSGDGEGTLCVWDVNTGRQLRVIKSEANQDVAQVSFHPNPEEKCVVVAYQDNTIRTWDIELGKEVDSLSDAGYQFAFHPLDANKIATAYDSIMTSNDSMIILWDIAEKAKLLEFDGHTYRVDCLCFSSDGKLLASAGGQDNAVHLWNAETGECIRVFEGHTYNVTSVCFSNDNKQLASASYDKTARLWDVESGQAVYIFSGHTEFVWQVAFHPDGKSLVSSSWDRCLRFWDLDIGREMHEASGHTREVGMLEYNAKANMFASHSIHDNTIQLWDATSCKRLHVLRPARDAIFSPDGKFIVSCGEKPDRLYVWSTASGQLKRDFPCGFYYAGCLSFSHDGKVLAVAGGLGKNHVALIDFASGNELCRLEGHTEGIADLAFSDDDTIVATASRDRIVRLWDVANGKQLRLFKGHEDEVGQVLFHPTKKSQLVSCSYDDGTIRFWDISSDEAVRVLQVKSVLEIQFSPDGRLLAAAIGDAVRLFDADTGDEVHVLKGHTGKATSISSIPFAFSPNNKLRASCGVDRTVRLWDVASGKQLHVLRGHTDIVLSVAFNGDGTVLASCGRDKSVLFWSVEDGSLKAYKGPAAPVILWCRNHKLHTTAGAAFLNSVDTQDKEESTEVTKADESHVDPECNTSIDAAFQAEPEGGHQKTEQARPPTASRNSRTVSVLLPLALAVGIALFLVRRLSRHKR